MFSHLGTDTYYLPSHGSPPVELASLTMSAGELASVPSDGSPLSQPQPLDKLSATLTPPTKNPLFVRDGLCTFVVDLTRVDGASGGSLTVDGDCKSTPDGVDAHCLPIPCQLPKEKAGLPSLTIDGVSPALDCSDSATADAPTDPPEPLGPDGSAVFEDDLDLLPLVEGGSELVATEASEQPVRPATAPPERVDDMFSLSGLAALQTFIPDDLFPDDILVHDPDNITNTRLYISPSQPDALVRYVRMFPNLETPSSEGSASQKSAFANRSPQHPVRAAHLYLRRSNRLGTGSHSTVYSAPFTLRLDTDSEEEITVRVAAKTASHECGAHRTLHLEAAVYNAFPRHLMDGQFPSGTSTEPASVTSDAAAAVVCGESCTTAPSAPEPQPAVVPKFYGYYAAVDADGCVIERSHSDFFCGADSFCSVSWPTRILLLEECGKPIVPEDHTVERRTECLKLVKRLHAAGFVQNSMFVRNVLAQPGPLSAPPEDRSNTTPSFRIIDFGRGEVFSHRPLGYQAYTIARASCEEEERKAKDRVLMLL